MWNQESGEKMCHPTTVPALAMKKIVKRASRRLRRRRDGAASAATALHNSHAPSPQLPTSSDHPANQTTIGMKTLDVPEP